MKTTYAGNKEKWIVYILRCVDDSLYAGITVDLEARIKKHGLGTASKYTRSRRPVVLVWQESATNESSARKREMQIKSWTRIQKINFIESKSWIHP